MSQFSRLIDETADAKNHSLAVVLLKAKVLAHRLKSRKFRQWVNAEIDGYSNGLPIPDYRTVRCSLSGNYVGHFNSQVRNVPLSTSIYEPDIRRMLEFEDMRKGVAHIEDLISGNGLIGKSLEIGVINYMREHGEQIDDMVLNHVQKSVPKQNLVSLLASVRSRLLDFLLELRDRHPELDRNDDALTDIKQSEIDAVADRQFYQCTFIKGSDIGDIYQAGQAGAMGPGARAEDMMFIQAMRGAIGNASLADLARELETLRGAMLAESKTADQDQAVAAVANAEEAAKKGDSRGVLSWLKSAGTWAFETATTVGTSVAAKAIEHSSGCTS